MDGPVTNRDLRNKLDNYVSKQNLEDELCQLPYLRDKTIREMIQNSIRSQWCKDQNAQSKDRLIAGGLGLLGGLVSSSAADFFG